MMSVAPQLAKRRAVSLPMPLLAPVMRMDFPRRSTGGMDRS